MRKTKIICTMGPAVESEEKIRELIVAGMDGARFNFSHGTHEEHKKRIDMVKKVSKEMNAPVALILDTKGPEIRVGNFKDKSIDLEEGQTFILYHDLSREGDQNGVGITYPYLGEDVRTGDRILVDDGLVSLTVTDVKNGDIVCSVDNGARISSKKSINVPGIDVDQVFISDRDRSDILFGIEEDFDFIAASFVRNQDDMKKLRKLLNVNGGEKIKIIAKIENRSGIENLEPILDIADGVMIARGDMGVEVPFDQLPAIQKNIIKACYRRGRIVITATQMLESMTEHPRPTRAEVSDVANAIYDGTTAIMLSGETAAGKYPIEAVKAMSRIAEYTENQINYQDRYLKNNLKLNEDIVNTITSASVEASFFLKAKAIVVATVTGLTADIASYYRPSVPIIASCTDEKASRQLKLDYGVYPYHAHLTDDLDEMRTQALSIARSSGVVKEGDLVVLVCGSLISGQSSSDTMIIAKA